MSALRVVSFRVESAQVRLVLAEAGDAAKRTRIDACVGVWRCNLDREDGAGEAVRVAIAPEGSLGRSWMVVDDKGEVPYAGHAHGALDALRQVRDGVREEVSVRDGVVVMHTPNKLMIRVCVEGDFKVDILTSDGRPVQLDADRDAYVIDRETNTLRHTLKFDPTLENLYGFGESSGPLLKNGRRLRVDARDSMGYSAVNSDPLYKHWPYGLSVRKEPNGMCTGLLYDSMRRATFDLGCEISAFRGRYRYFEVAEPEEGLTYYVVPASNPASVQTRLAGLIGFPALAPLWSLGYLGSSMAYTEDERATERLQHYLEKLLMHEIPCDGFHLSSGYTTDKDGRRCVFTWNTTRIPDPKGLFSRFNQQKVNVIANIKPWLLEEHPDFNKVRDSNGFFISERNPGQPAKGKFWVGGAGTSGQGCYLDFTSEGAVKWWISSAKSTLLDLGCKALWNDNNEYEVEDGYDALNHLQDGSISIARVGRALQTQLMARASYDALESSRSDDDDNPVLVVSRSGSIGTHRYAAQTWSGDNFTDWDTLKYNICMMVSLGLCGWPGSGPDVGGFAGQCPSAELFVRWCQCAAYMPRFSIHSSVWKSKDQGTTNVSDAVDLATTNEPWMFPDVLPQVKAIIRSRYRMRTWLFSLYVESRLLGYPVARPLLFHYHSDPEILRNPSCQFSFLLGEHLLVAPVVEPGTEVHSVYLPSEYNWYELARARRVKGQVSLDVPRYDDRSITFREFAGVPLFLREGGGFVWTSNEGFEGSHYDDTRGVCEVMLALDSETKSASCEWYEGTRGEFRLSAKRGPKGKTTLTVALNQNGPGNGNDSSQRKRRRALDLTKVREAYKTRRYQTRAYYSGDSTADSAVVEYGILKVNVLF